MEDRRVGEYELTPSTVYPHTYIHPLELAVLLKIDILAIEMYRRQLVA